MVLTSGATYFPQPALLILPDCRTFNLEDISFGFNVAGAYTISALATQPDPQRIGSPVSVSYRITNIGAGWLTSLPLMSRYDPAHLAFTSAAPPSDDTQNDGEIAWQDLASSLAPLASTASSIAGLAPGGSLTVVITFTAVADTTNLPGSATAITATSEGAFADPDGPASPLPAFGPLRTRQAVAEATVYFPTGATLSECSVAAEDDAFRLTWQTASEADILGFYVLRRDRGADGLTLVTPELIVAEHAGIDQGARYTYLDKGAASGNPMGYVVELIYLDGRTERQRVSAVAD